MWGGSVIGWGDGAGKVESICSWTAHVALGTRNLSVVMGTQQEIVQFTDDDDDDDDVCNSVIGDDDGGKRHFNTGGAISLQQ